MCERVYSRVYGPFISVAHEGAKGFLCYDIWKFHTVHTHTHTSQAETGENVKEQMRSGTLVAPGNNAVHRYDIELKRSI